ncbi:hypothetical protein [Streptomyces sp. CC208A]|uniref:hypothetical protein n=1 Tax=Streptomyces sp. CC208A TaxID=3044573 RepID=UPI0024A8769C|nr:hypothetical protein [Streptomyces sp. CC208A]
MVREGRTQAVARGVALLATVVLLTGVSACARVSVRCGESCAGQGYPPAGHEVLYDDGLTLGTYPGEWVEGEKRIRFRIDLRNSGAAPVPAGNVDVRLFESTRSQTLRKHTHDDSLEQEIPAGGAVSGFVVLRTEGMRDLNIRVMVRPRDGYEMARWSVVV